VPAAGPAGIARSKLPRAVRRDGWIASDPRPRARRALTTFAPVPCPKQSFVFASCRRTRVISFVPFGSDTEPRPRAWSRRHRPSTNDLGRRALRPGATYQSDSAGRAAEARSLSRPGPAAIELRVPLDFLAGSSVFPRVTSSIRPPPPSPFDRRPVPSTFAPRKVRLLRRHRHLHRRPRRNTFSATDHDVHAQAATKKDGNTAFRMVFRRIRSTPSDDDWVDPTWPDCVYTRSSLVVLVRGLALDVDWETSFFAHRRRHESGAGLRHPGQPSLTGQ